MSIHPEQNRPDIKKPSQKEWKNLIPWVALGIAVYGAFLSTLKCSDRRAEKARELEVIMVWGRADMKGGMEHKNGLQLVAVNPGHQKARITKAGIFSSNNSLLPYSLHYTVAPTNDDGGLPVYVEPDDNYVIALEGKDLKDLCDALSARGLTGTVTLVGFYIRGSDVLAENPFKSKPLQFNIDEALKLARDQIDTKESIRLDDSINNINNH